jgi:hypothetical protein
VKKTVWSVILYFSILLHLKSLMFVFYHP